ncbi:MAG: phosphatase PAP2 family protein, partial [Spirochaetia bacterium]
RTDSDLNELAGHYGPRFVVTGALLLWGVLAPELPAVAVIELPPGEPAALNEVLSWAGTAAALLTMGTAAVGGLISEWPDAIGAVSASAAVVAAAYAAKSYFKTRFRRTRPSAVLALSLDDPDDWRSFPSGHALLAWAGAGDALVRTVRGTFDPWLLATVTFEAVAVSFLRVAAGEHYPGDVIAGAAIGLAVGSIVSFVLLPL